MGIMTLISTLTTLTIFAALIIVMGKTLLDYRTSTGGSIGVGGPLMIGIIGVAGAIISGTLWVMTGFV